MLTMTAGWISPPTPFGCCNGFRVYQNNGDGSWSPTFAKNGGNSNQWCRFGDFDNHGHADLIVATDGTQVWSNDGAGQFAPLQNGLVLGFNIDLAVADVNNDGAADIAVEKNGSAQVYHFDLTTSTWQSISSGLPTGGVQGIRLADMDVDGNPEVVLWSSRSISICKADPNFNWSQIASFAIAETALAGMTIADLDHDGFNDVTYLASTGSGDNKHRVYLHVPENPKLNIIPLFPKGSEHLIGGSAQFCAMAKQRAARGFSYHSNSVFRDRPKWPLDQGGQDGAQLQSLPVDCVESRLIKLLSAI